MQDRKLQKSAQDILESLEEFISLYPDAIDKESAKKICKELRVVISPPKFTYPPPLIRAVPNGYFEMKRALRNDD